MQTAVYNDWYVRTDGRIGPWNVTDDTPTAEQIHNATKIYNALSAYGWSLSAIAGILGNMQHESNLNPAAIQKISVLPNNAANLSDVPNEVMQNYYGEYYTGVPNSRGYGIGLVQWDGKGITRQKFVGYCMNNGYIWYDGDAQMARLKYEYDNNLQWQSYTFYGITWTWSNYVTNNRTPEQSARIWMSCYEVSSGLEARQKNARYWYDYFSNPDPPPDPPTPDPPTPDPPEPPSPADWIGGDEFARLALAYNGQYLPYSQYDCIGYVNLVWRDIPVVQANNWNLTNGTNSLWRSTVTFNTTDPTGTTPTTELWWKGTIADCDYQWTGLPVGCLLFHQIPEDGDPPIPPQYAGDGEGNFVHVGIYVGNEKVMQSGGQDAGSVPGGGVHLSNYDPNAWTHVAFLVWVDTVNYYPPPSYNFPAWLKVWYTTQRRRLLKNVKRSI